MFELIVGIGLVAAAVTFLIQQRVIVKMRKDVIFINNLGLRNHASITQLRFKVAELAERTGNSCFDCDGEDHA